MVAGQNPQTAGVDGQGFMQPERGREIDHRALVEVAAMDVAPAPLLAHILVQAAEGVVDAAVEHQFRGALFHLLRGDLVQEGDGVVLHLAPEMRIQVGEDADDLGMPRPPQVVRQRAQAFVKVPARLCHVTNPSLHKTAGRQMVTP